MTWAREVGRRRGSSCTQAHPSSSKRQEVHGQFWEGAAVERLDVALIWRRALKVSESQLSWFISYYGSHVRFGCAQSTEYTQHDELARASVWLMTLDCHFPDSPGIVVGRPSMDVGGRGTRLSRAAAGGAPGSAPDGDARWLRSWAIFQSGMPRPATAQPRIAARFAHRRR